MYKIDSIAERAYEVVTAHKLEGGQYSRWLFQNEKGNRNLGPNEYGTADAANILYTLNRFPRGQAAKEHAEALKSFQNPETGLFSEPTHHTIHTTAHCVAALELFDDLPSYPLHDLIPYFNSTEKLHELLEGLDWKGTPWPMSHRGAGIYVCGVLTDSVTNDWIEDYFDWIYRHSDPKYGLSNIGTIDAGTAPICHHLYGWFHYMFNMEYQKFPLRFPERLIDSCLDMYYNKKLTDRFGREIGFMEIDWVFALNRATRQTPYRFDEAKKALADFGNDFLLWLGGLDFKTDDGINDLHQLFGTLCAIAELQAALPGEFPSKVPLRLVLNRRPFI